MQKQFQQIVDYIQSKKFQEAINLCLQFLQHNNHPQIHLFLAIAHGENGNTQESYKLFENLIKHFSNNPDIYYNYALILQNSHQTDKAVNQYKKCISLYPQNASAWNNLGEIYRSRQQFTKAHDALLQCIKLNPSNVQYNRNLALNYYQNKIYDKALPILIEIIQGHDFEIDDGIAALDSLISLRQLKHATEIGTLVLTQYKNNEEILNLLGLNELEKRKFNLSIKYLKRALTIKPNYFSAMCHLATAYLFHGKIKKGKKLLKKIINFKTEAAFVFVCMMYEISNQSKHSIKSLKKGLKLFPHNKELLLLKTKILTRKKKYNRCLSLIEAVLSDIKNDSLKSTALYEKGIVLDKLGQYDSAWNSFILANNLRLKQWQNSHAHKDPFLETCEAIANSFASMQPMNADDSCENTGGNLIFIIGFPRSGTTLLDSILSAHSDITVLEEAPIIGETYDQIAEINPKNYAEKVLALKPNELKKLRDFYFKSLKNYSQWNHQGYLVDKSPLNTLHVAFIHTLFPQAKIIFSQRHPLDACLSCFFQDFKINDFMTNMTNIEDTAKTYNAMLKVWDVSIKRLNIDVYYQSYEDLVSNFEIQARKLLMNLNIQWQDNILIFQTELKNRAAISTPSYNQVNQKIYQTAKNRYLNYKQYLGKTIETLDSWIKYFHYDTNPDIESER